jgi:HEAT repeat protein/ATP/ADP translocase
LAAGAGIFWRILPDVRLRERPRFLFFGILFFLLTAAETVGLAGADALFLARVGIGDLPLALVLASLAAMVLSLVYAAAVGTFRNDGLFVVLLLVAMGGLLVAGAGVVLGQTWAFFGLIGLFYVNRAVFLNHYWTFAGDYFDTISSKRLFALLAVGASAGGMVGGAAAAGLTFLAGPEWLIVGWVVLLAAAAALVLSQRGRLRRWIPLEAMEADDTSVEGMRGADRYLRRSSLGRWLVASAVGMVVALYVAQYAYLAIFAEAFPDAAELAFFFGVYLAVANLIEMGVETGVSRWLIPRFGVPTANLLHPVVTLVSFLGLAASQSVPMAVLARTNRELLENALANPVRNLTYNALPHRYRGRVRAFLEGIVLNGGMATAGVFLVVVAPRVSVAALCVLGAFASLLYLLANLRVRQEYVRTLVDEIGSGHFDVRDLEGEIGRGEVEVLARFWSSLLADTRQPPVRLLTRMAGVLARHGLVEPLMDALGHTHARIRLAALEALVGISAPNLEEVLAVALDDAEPAIQRAALACLRRDEKLAREPELVDRLRACLLSTDPEVQVGAAALLGSEGLSTLDIALRGDDPEITAACLLALPDTALHRVVERVEDPVPQVRAAALDRLARAGPGPGLAGQAILSSLRHADARVRAAAVRLLAVLPDPEIGELLGERLGDASREVRRLAVSRLVDLGERGFGAATASLDSHRTAEAEAAMDVLAAIGSPEAFEALRQAFRERARSLWRVLFALELIRPDGPVAMRFLRVAHEDAFAHNGRVAFAILARIEDPAAVRALQKSLRFGSSRERADALEVLSHLGDREGARLLVDILESAPTREKSSYAASVVRAARSLDEVVSEAPGLGRFAQMASLACADPGTDPVTSERPMERLLLLRTVPLFSQMSLEQLEAIDELMREVQYLDGEVICREGEAGDELFVLLDGEVRFYKQAGEPEQIHLSTMAAGSYFGEMAILSDEPRSATAVVSKPARLLSLRGEPLKELILDMPEISFEIFRVLTARVKAAEGRLHAPAAGSETAPTGAGPRSGGGS